MSRGVCYLVLALCMVSASAFAQSAGSKGADSTLKVGSTLEDSTGKTSSEIVRWMEHMAGIEIKI